MKAKNPAVQTLSTSPPLINMVYFDLFHPLGIDFPQFYEAVKMIFSGQNPYLHLLTSPGPWNYPPTAFLFLFWLNFPSYDFAGAIWNILSLLSFVISVWLLLKIVLPKTNNVLLGYWFIGLLVLLSLTFFPLKHNLASGQINNFLLLLIVLSSYFSEPFYAAYAFVIKIIPGLFIFYFFLQKKYKAILMFFAWSVILVFLSFVVVPVNIQKLYFSAVAPQAWPLSGKEIYYNQSLLGFLARSFQTTFAVQLSYYLLALLILLLTLWRGREVSKNGQFAAISSLLLILPPLVWQHHYVLAVIPLVLLFKENWLPVVLAYFLVANNVKDPGGIPKEFGLLLSHQFLGAFLLWLTALWKEKVWTLAGIIWVGLLLLLYISNLLCHAHFCF